MRVKIQLKMLRSSKLCFVCASPARGVRAFGMERYSCSNPECHLHSHWVTFDQWNMRHGEKKMIQTQLKNAELVIELKEAKERAKDNFDKLTELSARYKALSQDHEGLKEVLVEKKKSIERYQKRLRRRK